MVHGPFIEFQSSIQVLDQRAATLDPIAIVAVQDAIDVSHLGAVNMATDHPVVAPLRASLATASSKSVMKFKAFFTLFFR